MKYLHDLHGITNSETLLCATEFAEFSSKFLRDRKVMEHSAILTDTGTA